MFSLESVSRFWLYTRPVDMRKSFNGLSGIVTNAMQSSYRNGDVYIFVNNSRNMVKMLRQEENGLVIYAMRLDLGRVRMPNVGDGGAVSYGMEYGKVVEMIKSAMDSPYARRMRMLSKTFE